MQIIPVDGVRNVKDVIVRSVSIGQVERVRTAWGEDFSCEQYSAIDVCLVRNSRRPKRRIDGMRDVRKDAVGHDVEKRASVVFKCSVVRRPRKGEEDSLPKIVNTNISQI